MKFSYKKQLDTEFAEAVRRTKEALAKEGLGIIMEIDVRETLKKKIDVNFEKYVILGACDPRLAYQALLAEKEMGLMLPCNIIVYEDNKKIFVSAILPTRIISAIKNDEICRVGEIAEEKLKRAIDSI